MKYLEQRVEELEAQIETFEAVRSRSAGIRYGKPDQAGRVPMTPHDFYLTVYAFESRMDLLGLHPRRTSGRRDEKANEAANGVRKSKHICSPTMAVDFVFGAPSVKAGSKTERMILQHAHALGLFALFHDVGSGWHLHIQGLPTGPISALWLDDWATDATKEWAKRVYEA